MSTILIEKSSKPIIKAKSTDNNVYLVHGKCYDSNISPIYHGCPTPCNGCGTCSLSDTSCPTWLSVPMFSLLLQLKYSLIYRRHPVDSRCLTPRDGHSIFSLLDNLHPIRPSVPMFFLFIMFHLSFFQIYFHSYLAYLISDISQGTCI